MVVASPLLANGDRVDRIPARRKGGRARIMQLDGFAPLLKTKLADALFPGEWTFDLAQKYVTLKDDTILAQAIAAGHLPVDSFVTECGAPDVKKGKVTPVAAMTKPKVAVWPE